MSKKQNDPHLRERLAAVPSLGCVEDDIRDALRETGKRCIQQILDTLEYRYRQNENLAVTPQSIWPLLRARSRQLYMEYADQVTKEFGSPSDK